MQTIILDIKNYPLLQVFIYIGTGFIAGFITAWVIRSQFLMKISKLQKSTQGFLESERLMKETLQRENVLLHQTKQATELSYTRELQQALDLNRIMQEDILLLQQSNEETEALFKAGEPALHELKLKLIEANNNIARYKAQLGIK